MKSYRSLFSRSKTQDVESAFAHFYAVNNDYDEPFKSIARKTVDGFGSWSFTQQRFISRYARSEVPKLRNYLDYTFVRLVDMETLTPGEHFRYTDDLDWVAFNTGLQNTHGVDLLMIFQKFKPRIGDDKPHSDWVYKGCFASNERGYRERFGSVVPEIAYYSLDSRDFVFNTQFRLEKDGFDHLLERGRERAGMPAGASDDAVRNYLRGALEMIVPKIKRNYKVAIPVYYVEDKKMQLLLPFASISDANDISCFLVDRNDDDQSYGVKTIYDLDHAYFSARLITRPDKEWLNP